MSQPSSTPRACDDQPMPTATRQTDERPSWRVVFLAAFVAVVATMLGTASASATTSSGAETRVGASSSSVEIPVGASVHITAGQQLGEVLAGPEMVVATGVAANAEANIGRANFAQRSFSETFSKGGAFSGRTIDDVAGSLRSGAMSPKDVPIDVIVRGGNTLILNTRSSQALIRGGISRSSWNVIDRTGQAAYEARLSGQLSRNGLTSSGTGLP